MKLTHEQLELIKKLLEQDATIIAICEALDIDHAITLYRRLKSSGYKMVTTRGIAKIEP